MLDLLKKLLGLAGEPTQSDPSPPAKADISEMLTRLQERDPVTDRYFELHAGIEQAKSKGDFQTAITHARETYRLLPAFVEACKRQYGRFDIMTSVAVHVGGTLMAVMGNREGIEELSRVLSEVPDLSKWKDVAKTAASDLEIVQSILELLKHQPGILQKDLKRHLGTTDGHRLALLASWLEKAGRIRRDKEGKSYRLFLVAPAEASAASSTKPESNRMPASHGLETRQPRNSRILDPEKITWLPLPPAPPFWEEKVRRAGSATETATTELRFSTGDGTPWKIVSEERMSSAARPDPAFTEMHPTKAGIFLVDPRGRAERRHSSIANIQVRNRAGAVSVERELSRNVYRIGLNPLGNGIIFMSSDCVIHAYDAAIEGILELFLWDNPEIQSCIERFEIAPEQLRNHVRCVGLSHDNSRFLFTVVDEVWCCSVGGDVLWGLRLPLKEDWAPASVRNFSTNIQVRDAVDFLGLKYPLTFDDIKRRHRELAKQWHPDLNQSDTRAHEQMQRLNHAFEVLTGSDDAELLKLKGQEGPIRYERQLSTFTVGGVEISANMVISGTFAADWIYAANFGAASHSIFAASYSGHVIEISPEGVPLRAYDIGAVPRRIADTGDYLYILTDTRLYVLSGNKLHTVVDVFDKGDLIIAETGFGLLERKQFRWFRDDGVYLGSVLTRDPIRLVYSAPTGVVVETRQHRAVMEGVPSWWEK